MSNMYNSFNIGMCFKLIEINKLDSTISFLEKSYNNSNKDNFWEDKPLSLKNARGRIKGIDISAIHCDNIVYFDIYYTKSHKYFIITPAYPSIRESIDLMFPSLYYINNNKFFVKIKLETEYGHNFWEDNLRKKLECLSSLLDYQKYAGKTSCIKNFIEGIFDELINMRILQFYYRISYLFITVTEYCIELDLGELGSDKNSLLEYTNNSYEGKTLKLIKDLLNN